MVQLSHKTILLVEDEFLIAMAEKAILEDYGYSVLLAHTGEDAVHIMEKENSIDLILMDINLGKGIDGTEAAKQILKNHDLPLIFLSSHTEREIVDKTEGITSYGYIVKDSGETVLIQSIKMAFRLFNAQMSRQEKEDLKLKSMVLDQIKDFVTITDTKGIVTYVNKIQEKELGLSKEDIIGKSIRLFGENPERGGTQREILSETLNKGSWRGEVVNRTADGRDIILNCRTQVIYDEKGNPISLCGISTDITEQKEYEEKLRRSEHLQRLILSAIPDMLMRFDRDGRYLDILNYREDELAMPRDEVIGKKVSDIIPGDLGTRLEKAILTVLKTNKVESVEYDLDVPAGHSSFEARIVPFSENEVIAFIRDVSQRKKTEEALIKSEEKYRLIVENANDGIEISQDDKIIFCNTRFARMLGYTVKEIKDISFKNIFTEEGIKYLYEREKSRKSGKPEPNYYETTFYKKDGKIIHVDIKYEIIDYLGHPATFAIIRDITQRKKAELLLRESEEKYRLIMDNSLDAILLTNPNGQIISANKSACKMFGMTEEELISAGREGIVDIHDPRLVSLLEERRQHGYASGELTYFRKDGTSFEAEVSSAIFYNSRGESRTSMIIRDVTERKRTEKKVEALLREKELLLKETHHRIKNNMGIIKSLLNLQAQKTDRMDSRIILKDAVSRVQSMMVLYDKLYHSESYTELNVKDFLPSLIHDIVALFQGEKPVRTDLHIDRIVMDSRTLSTLGIILNECITNSMKYAFDAVEDPRITLRVNKDKDKMVVSYSDNGSGCLDKELPDKCQNFGFQLMDMLVQQLNGTLRIDSTHGMKIVVEF